MYSKKKDAVAGALKLSLSALAAAVAIAVPVAGQAGDTANMTVSANVVSQCRFASVQDMNFGDVDPLVGDVASATVSIQCNRGATVNLSSNSTGIMSGPGGSTLTYALAVGGGAAFNNCATSAPIANGDTAVDASALWSASGGPKPVTLCGTIPAGQDTARPGAHSQTVLLTIAN